MKQYWKLIVVNSIVLAGFGTAAFMQQNKEFVFYLLIVGVLASTLLISTKYVKYPTLLLWMLSVWGWMHMAGGVILVRESVLYDAILIPILQAPLSVLRYDQLVHVYGSILITITAWYVLKDRIQAPPVVISGVIVVVGMGLGTINEIIELIAVLTIEQTSVGDYFNIAFDLLANLVGALIAGIWVYQRERT